MRGFAERSCRLSPQKCSRRSRGMGLDFPLSSPKLQSGGRLVPLWSLASRLNPIAPRYDGSAAPDSCHFMGLTELFFIFP